MYPVRSLHVFLSVLSREDLAFSSDGWIKILADPFQFVQQLLWSWIDTLIYSGKPTLISLSIKTFLCHLWLGWIGRVNGGTSYIRRCIRRLDRQHVQSISLMLFLSLSTIRPGLLMHVTIFQELEIMWLAFGNDSSSWHRNQNERFRARINEMFKFAFGCCARPVLAHLLLVTDAETTTKQETARCRLVICRSSDDDDFSSWRHGIFLDVSSFT